MSIFFSLSYKDALVLEDALRTDVEFWQGNLNYIRRTLDEENKTEEFKKALEKEGWSEEFYKEKVKKHEEQKRVLAEIVGEIKRIENKKFIEVSNEKANEIINTRKPLGLFWTREKQWFVAIDNSTGDAWTECFLDKKECFKYLTRED